MTDWWFYLGALFLVTRRIIAIPASVILFLFFHYTGMFEWSTTLLKFSINDLGGFFIKTIQFLASHNEFFFKDFPNYQSALETFYDDTTPVGIETIESILHNHRIEPELLFPFPIGSGSIAQVHRGRWKEQDVIFKVQKPGSKMQFLVDLFFIRLLLYLLTLWIGEIPSTPFLHEFVDCVTREFDFNQEARAMIQACLWIQKDQNFEKYIKVPRVYAHSEKLIVMEFCSHKKWNAPGSCIDNISLTERILMCQALTKMFAEMIMRHRFVHTDPHIGNLCISSHSNKFILLDWGQNKNLSESTIRGLAHIIVSDNTDIPKMLEGMTYCGIEIQGVFLQQMMLVLDFFNHNNNQIHKSWDVVKSLIYFTTQTDRNHRNPFKKQSRELVLILKTHDLLDVISNKMRIPRNTAKTLFPTQMMKASHYHLQNHNPPS
jgi:predicted unusual protein kinase regulating ubiquinone biosynthesis (AarF/ABC1/UbiB family)